MKKGKVLITGASGYMGKNLISRLSGSWDLLPVYRKANASSFADKGAFFLPNGFGRNNDWSRALFEVDVVVHLAAMVHSAGQASIEEYREVNVEGCLCLAKQAAELGVKRFVFMSSVAVYGVERSSSSLTEDGLLAPNTNYGLSKYEAETRLLSLGRDTGLEVIIIRPPMVYGPEAPGNMSRLIWLIKLGFPLPLLKIENKRSFIFIDNLLSFIELCLESQNVAGEVFLVSDGDDISTSELSESLRQGLGVDTKFFYLPSFLVTLGGRLLFQGKKIDQLFGSLQLNVSKANKLTGWAPEFKFHDAVKKTVSRHTKP